MKIKGKISVFLASVVCILLLVQFIVPHHHHEGVPCFSLSISHHDCGDEAGECSHSSEDCTHSGSCVLEEEVIFTVMDNKHDCFSSVCIHDHFPSLFRAILMGLYDRSFIQEEKVLFRPVPYLIHYSSVYVATGFGLRAPPYYNN